MRKFVFGIAALAAVTATEGFAAEKARPVVAPPSFVWSGFYVGANIGGAWGSRGVSLLPNDAAASVFGAIVTVNGGSFNSSPSFDTSGVLGGVQAGYNYQFNPNWLVGVETDFNWTNIKGSSQTVTGGAFNVTETFKERIDWFGTVRARLGYLPTENLLAFLTGGFAYGKVKREASFFKSPGLGIAAAAPPFGWDCGIFNTTGSCFTGSSSEVATGWTLGGGIEYHLWTNITLKAEYLYVNLDGNSFPFTATATFNPPSPQRSSFNVDFGRADFNVVRIGLNVRL